MATTGQPGGGGGDAGNSSQFEALTEAQRRQLQKTIEQRRYELEEKRKLIQKLIEQGGPVSFSTQRSGVAGRTDGGARGADDASATTVGTTVAASDLLGQVLNAISEAKTKAEPVIVPQEENLSGGRGPGAAGRSPSGASHRRALKQFVGALQEVPGTVDVIITPQLIDSFDKSCQCDLILPPVPVVDTAVSGVAPASIGPRRDESALDGGQQRERSKDLLLERKRTGVLEEPKTTLRTQERKHPTGSRDLPVVYALGEDERKRVLFDPSFDVFFDVASRQLERAMGESEMFEVYSQYTKVAVSSDEDTSEGQQMRPLAEFTDAKWSAGRPTITMSRHQQFSEIFLASYGTKQAADVFDPEGCALVWNLGNPNRAQHAFSCQSAVCSAVFETYRPHLVMGGTYSGGIVLWDSRAKTRPVQRTALSAKSHHHPVYDMRVVGSQHAHNLVSLDGDGRLCLWSLAMLANPTETLNLKRGGKDIRPLRFDFLEGENNQLVGGCDDGMLFQAQIHGARNGLSESYTGHQGPVTNVHWHPFHEKVNCGDLLLSSSFDWTVKLWCPKLRTTPVHTFDIFEDYVTGVQWHPTSPAVFAACQVDGSVRLWNLSKDIDVPFTRTEAGKGALMGVEWSPDGSKLMVGDSEGSVSLFGVPTELAHPRLDAIESFTSVVEDFKTSVRTTGEP